MKLRNMKRFEAGNVSSASLSVYDSYDESDTSNSKSSEQKGKTTQSKQLSLKN